MLSFAFKNVSVIANLNFNEKRLLFFCEHHSTTKLTAVNVHELFDRLENTFKNQNFLKILCFF